MKHFQMSSTIYLLFSMLVLLGIRYHISNLMSSKLQSELQNYIVLEEVENEICVFKSSVPYSKKGHTTSEVTAHKKPKKAYNKRKKSFPKTRVSQKLININGCTKDQLIALPGLAEVLSTRILKFRDRLGGFHSVDQLTDVYGIPPETVEKIKSRFICDRIVRKLNLTDDDFKKILRHPYIDYEQTKGIKNYIRKNGEIDELEKLMLATDKSREDATKLWPYLTNSINTTP